MRTNLRAARHAALALILLAFGCSNADPTDSGVTLAPGARDVALGSSFADPGEGALVESIGAALQGVFLDVAARTGVRLADAYAVSEGHGPCAADGERWIEGLVAQGSVPYHPNAVGHEAMARLVLDALAAAPSRGVEQ